MTHEKIFKRKDGSQVKLSVWLYVHENKSNWGYLMWIKECGSDRWIDPFSDRDYVLRIINPKLKEGIKVDAFDHYVSSKEILEAKLELWKLIKPV
ncbi:hypothetical protein [Dyadobacter sp. 32]|uniref:hypothetical protein n=1 Tax=Dyadobacter sp. 32 TaxID=538966 RepID=UPI0011EC498F